MERAKAEDDARGGQKVFDPVTAEPTQVEHCDERGGRRARESRDDEGSHEERIAGNVEAFAEAEERREHDQGQQGLLEVEALHEMGNGQSDDEDDRKLPGPATPARERARKPDQRQPECQRGDASGSRNAGRQHAAHEIRAVGELRSESGDDAGDSHRRGGPTEHELPAKSAKPHARQGTWRLG